MENVDVEKSLLEEKKRRYLMIRNNNLLFGLCNLVVFMAIYIIFTLQIDVIAPSKVTLSLLLILQVIVGVGSFNHGAKRKKQARREGLLLFQLKPLDRLVQFAGFFFTYLLSARMFVEGIYYAQKYIEWGFGYGDALGNVWLAVLFASLGVAALVVSFTDDYNREINEYFLR